MTWLDLSVWVGVAAFILTIAYLVAKDARTSREAVTSHPMRQPGESHVEYAKRVQYDRAVTRAHRWGWDDGQVVDDLARGAARRVSLQALPVSVHTVYASAYTTSCREREAGL